ncbi:MAG TPA: VWA domain-containing protein [Pyrinomonadaceae bacterium]|nr:VWA domain-containing protein [Pyrinomonadaceae bacterium]
MKKIAIILLVVFGFTFVSAQSGRRIEPPPAPPEEVENADVYSESAPSKRLMIYPPNIRERLEQAKNKSDAKTPNQASSIPVITDADDDVIKIESTLVTIPVSVYDRNGLYIPGLRQQDFKIFEDGEEQEIAYFGTTEKPFTVVLLIDVSPSTEYKIEEIQRAAIAFVDQLKPQDSVMVIEFGRKINVLTEATNNRQKIYKAIKKADFGGGTSLYDAVQFSLRKRLSQIEGRKAIVLFTDGVDTTSGKASYDETVYEAEENDSMIFPVYYNTFFDMRGGGSVLNSPFPGITLGGGVRGTRPEDYALGRQYLNDLADATGGRVFRPEATPGGLTAAFEGIAEELRRQYNIGYYPKAEGKTGQRKQIKVRVNRPKLVVRARDSYIVGQGSQTQSKN